MSQQLKYHPPGGHVVKTLAIRLEDEMHAQLTMLAQLEELTVTDAIRQAINSFVEAKRSNPELGAKAEAALADIDRDAASRRDAIASLFESGQPEAGRASSKQTGGAEDKVPARPGRAKRGTPPVS
jgi:predicted transcriptional regulator